MNQPARPRLLTPLRISIALHALVLLVLVQLAPLPAPAPVHEPMSLRFVGDSIPEPAEPEVALAPSAGDPVDETELPDFDVLLPAVLIEDTLPPLPDATAAREPPVATLHIPANATRKPAPPNPVAARPQAAPRPTPRRVPRVVRRPGTLRGFYPRSAQQRGIEGTAMVLVQVDANGQVIRARVRTSSGHASLDAAALRVARLYEFAPGVPGRALLPVPFRLSDR